MYGDCSSRQTRSVFIACKIVMITFHHQIETDGVSCSIILIRKDKAGRMVKQPKAKKGSSEKYIDEISDEEREQLVYKKLVGIDPNMGDLLYCVNSDQRDQTKFRYSQDMRRKETKFKKYRNILQTQKCLEGIQGHKTIHRKRDEFCLHTTFAWWSAPFWEKHGGYFATCPLQQKIKNIR